MPGIYKQFVSLLHILDIWDLTDWIARHSATLYQLYKFIVFEDIGENE